MAKKTQKTPDPTKTSWADLPRKEREKLAKMYRRESKSAAADAKADRKSAEEYAERGLSALAKSSRRYATRDEKDAAFHAALADLIERNLGHPRLPDMKRRSR